ncbi:MAG: ATP-dependent helicase [Actinomycetota bacterium]
MFDIASLTPEQKKAATYRGGNLLIVAGAGTGKTTTLTHRLAHLMETGVPAQRILLLTFSRRAAGELLHRAEQLTGEAVSAAWGGTFHAVANRILRRYGGALGLPPSFTVLDQADTADLLSLCRNDLAQAGAEQLAVSKSRKAKKQVLADILSRCVNTRTQLSEILRKNFPWCAEERAEIRATFEAYTLRKRSRWVLDYDDLLLCWAALLEVPDVAKILQSQFDHILVDEYQDTNPLQADLLAGMAAGGATITAVGDDAQAIYSFRAATHRNIMEFPTRFKAEVVTLEQNHRSTPLLLAATNAVIDESTERHPKLLWSTRQNHTKPALVRCEDEAEQSRQVCKRILEHHERGMPLQAHAVLVRTGHHSDLLELELAARNIPFRKYGGLKFLEAAHVKDLVCLLRLVENPHDELAWFRILQLLEGVGPGSARKLTNRLVAAESPASVLADCFDAAPAEISEGARGLGSAVVDSIPLALQNAGLAIERVRKWLDPSLERRYPNAKARRGDLDQLQHAAGATASLDKFLADLTLDPPTSTSDLAGPPHLDDDFITISTIHSAKGCEWDVVHVIHLTDGHIPSDMATGDAEAIEEERRLLYVAMTRARNYLYTYMPLRYHFRPYGRDDKHGYGQLTRFFTKPVLEHLDDSAPAQPLTSNEPDQQPQPMIPAAMSAVDRLVSSLWD